MSQEKRSDWKSLLRRWFSGEITVREEQELDRFAQDDPFLAEALEGYRSQPEANHSAKVDQLKTRFIQKKDRRAIPLWRVAASVAVLILAGFALWQVNSSPKADLAEMTPEVPEETFTADQEAQTAADELSADPIQETETQASPRSTEPAIKPNNSTLAERKPSASKITSERASSIKKDIPEGEPKPGSIALADDTEKEQEQVAKKAKEVAKAPIIAFDEVEEAVRPAENQARIQMEKEASPLSETPNSIRSASQIPSSPAFTLPSENILVNGKIISEQGKPVAGARIIAPDTNIQTTSDQFGNFLLPTGASHDARQSLEVAYQNYPPQTYFYPRKTDSLPLILLEPSAASISRSANRKSAFLRQKAKAPDSQILGPKIGYPAFEKYIKENLKYPKAAKNAGAKGTVVLQFEIDDKGRPANILISKSLGYGCDQEAIRLIRKGSDWLGGGGAIAVYTILFE